MSKYNEFDPWEHYEDEGGVVKIRAPKIKKIKISADIYRGFKQDYNQIFRNIAALVNFGMIT